MQNEVTKPILKLLNSLKPLAEKLRVRMSGFDRAIQAEYCIGRWSQIQFSAEVGKARDGLSFKVYRC